MPDIVDLNGGLVKTTPSLTDLLPIQEVGGITRPTRISGVIGVTVTSAQFVEAVQEIVSTMVVGGAGTTVTYDLVARKFTITAP